MLDEKGSVNKSQAIRDYLAKHQDQGPSEVARKLTEQLGEKVTPGFVSQIKSKSGKPSKKKTPRKKAAKPSGQVPVSDLIAAKKFVNELGSVEKAKKVLSVMEKLS